MYKSKAPPPKIFFSSFSNDVYDGRGKIEDEDENEEEDHIYRRLEDMVSEDHYREFYYQVRTTST